MSTVPESILTKTCGRCDEPVFDYKEDAQDYWDYFESTNDYGVGADARVHLVEAALADVPKYCGYCDHVLNKDD